MSSEPLLETQAILRKPMFIVFIFVRIPYFEF